MVPSSRFSPFSKEPAVRIHGAVARGGDPALAGAGARGGRSAHRWQGAGAKRDPAEPDAVHQRVSRPVHARAARAVRVPDPRVLDADGPSAIQKRIRDGDLFKERCRNSDVLLYPEEYYLAMFMHYMLRKKYAHGSSNHISSSELYLTTLQSYLCFFLPLNSGSSSGIRDYPFAPEGVSLYDFASFWWFSADEHELQSFSSPSWVFKTGVSLLCLHFWMLPNEELADDIMTAFRKPLFQFLTLGLQLWPHDEYERISEIVHIWLSFCEPWNISHYLSSLPPYLAQHYRDVHVFDFDVKQVVQQNYTFYIVVLKKLLITLLSLCPSSATPEEFFKVTNVSCLQRVVAMFAKNDAKLIREIYACEAFISQNESSKEEEDIGWSVSEDFYYLTGQPIGPQDFLFSMHSTCKRLIKTLFYDLYWNYTELYQKGDEYSDAYAQSVQYHRREQPLHQRIWRFFETIGGSDGIGKQEAAQSLLELIPETFQFDADVVIRGLPQDFERPKSRASRAMRSSQQRKLVGSVTTPVWTQPISEFEMEFLLTMSYRFSKTLAPQLGMSPEDRPFCWTRLLADWRVYLQLLILLVVWFAIQQCIRILV